MERDMQARETLCDFISGVQWNIFFLYRLTFAVANAVHHLLCPEYAQQGLQWWL